MARGTRFLKKMARRAVTRVMDRVGGRLVSGFADTSSDSPSAAYKPKRDLYDKLQQQDEASGESDRSR